MKKQVPIHILSVLSRVCSYGTHNQERSQITLKKTPHIPSSQSGRPVGEYLVSGFTSDYKNSEYFFDYNNGATNITGSESFALMPEKVIRDTPMSLWNVSLEIHTGRIYQSLIGGFYVLIVPANRLAGTFYSDFRIYSLA